MRRHKNKKEAVGQGRMCLMLALLVTFGAACANEVTSDGAIEPEVNTSAPIFTSSPGAVEHEAPSSINAVSVDGSTLVAGTEDGVFGVFGLELLELYVYTVEGEPVETGPVYAMASRENGVMIAAQNGLFHTVDGAVLYSPLSAATQGLEIRHLDVAGSGEAEEIWLASTEGVYRVVSGFLEKIDIPGEDGAPVGVAATTDHALIAYEAAIYEIDLGVWTYRAVNVDAGTVHGTSSSNDKLALATDQGLLVRSESGAYTHYTLSDSSEANAAFGVSFDRDQQPVTLTKEGLVVVQEADTTGLANTDALESSTSMAVDIHGHVWFAKDTTLTGYMVGDLVRFEEQVVPALAVCNGCHLTGSGGAPKHDFSNYGEVVALSDSIVQRVSTGNMPPSEVGPLSTEHQETLLLWYTTGMNP